MASGYDRLHPIASVSCASQQTDLAGEHSLRPALNFGTSCQHVRLIQTSIEAAPVSMSVRLVADDIPLRNHSEGGL